MGWQEDLEESICTVAQLKKYIHLTPKEQSKLNKVIQRHPMRISKYYMSLIDRYDPKDPLRKMAVPSLEELDISGSYDTSGEKKSTKMPGLQHKYEQTALILATNRCGTYCRFCFRKRLVGLPNTEIISRLNKAVTYIKKHKEINNVLISGGDPLILPTEIIGEFLEKLVQIDHLDFIRFGSRVPVTFPHRILKDKSLVNVLKKHSHKDRRIYVVTHFNHPREITSKSRDAVDFLIRAGVIVNDQTVLLGGVNDHSETLAELMKKLVSIGVNPYYVFQCRPVKRVKHYFQVPLFRGCHIVDNAKKKLDGHSKRFKYIMAHDAGKIEILGIMGNYIYFKQHQARKPNTIGKTFKRKLNRTAGWLNEL